MWTTAALQVYPATTVFKMLVDQDRDERGEWVAKIREESTRTLGKIFKEVFASRKEVWRPEKLLKDKPQLGGDCNQGLANQVKDLRQQIAALKSGTKRNLQGQPVKPTKAKGGGQGRRQGQG